MVRLDVLIAFFKVAFSKQAVSFFLSFFVVRRSVCYRVTVRRDRLTDNNVGVGLGLHRIDAGTEVHNTTILY